jgi:hypothetical protein
VSAFVISNTWRTVIASAQNVNDYAGGAVISAFGSAGIQILQVIVVSDLTTLRWRSFVNGLVSTPFFINAFVSANIAQQVLARSGWYDHFFPY